MSYRFAYAKRLTASDALVISAIDGRHRLPRTDIISSA
jgi:hypothetical protein